MESDWLASRFGDHLGIHCEFGDLLAVLRYAPFRQFSEIEFFGLMGWPLGKGDRVANQHL